jgi:hypothetical protein
MTSINVFMPTMLGAAPVQSGVGTPFGSVASFESSQGFFFGNGGAALLLTFERQTFTHKSASAVDTSIDDGRPNFGSVRCRTLVTYNLATPDAQVPDACAIALRWPSVC